MPDALVIDDSRVIRMVLARTLKELGFTPVEAVDGREAITVMERDGTGIDLVMVDWNMPKVNGLDFVKYVRARPQFDDVQLVMVTTETELDQMVRALEAGANEYVMKPFTAEAVQDKLRLLGVVS
jgi:two-component system chemotaxis response regulator CheY